MNHRNALASLYFFLMLAITSCTSTEKKTSPIIHHGTEIAFTDQGMGDTTLLFVHGWCINKEYWVGQIDQFKNQYRTVAVDLPGFGKSGKNKNEWTLESYAGDVNFLINELDLSNVILIGHSMAGNIVLETALRSDKVISIIGVDNFKEVGLTRDAALQAELDGFFELLSSNFQEIAPAYAEGALFHPTTSEEVKSRVMNDFKNASPNAAVESLSKHFDYSSLQMQKLGKLNQKLYLINSDVTGTDTEALQASGADYALFDIHATGHYPMIEKTSEFNAILAQILDSH